MASGGSVVWQGPAPPRGEEVMGARGVAGGWGSGGVGRGDGFTAEHAETAETWVA